MIYSRPVTVLQYLPAMMGHSLLSLNDVRHRVDRTPTLMSGGGWRPGNLAASPRPEFFSLQNDPAIIMKTAIFLLMLICSLIQLGEALRLRPGLVSPFRFSTRCLAAPARLTTIDRQAFLPTLMKSGWTLLHGRDAIKKSFEFKDFKSAFAFMTEIAEHAERLQHHPEWFNVYNKLDVTLSTHDCDGLSKLDVEMASLMETLYARHK